MKGLVIAKRVRMNHEGCTIIKDLRFFRNLYKVQSNGIYLTAKSVRFSPFSELRSKTDLLSIC